MCILVQFYGRMSVRAYTEYRSFSRARSSTVNTVDNWSAVLRLATMWSCADMRLLAIEQLTELAPPVEKLALSLAYDVPEWRIPSYVALSLRPEILAGDEAEKLPVRDVLRIASAREAVRDGRVAATPEAITNYFVQDFTNLLNGAEILPHITPPTTVTPFTDSERTRIATQLKEGKYLEALSDLTPSQITPFCALLQESWGARVTEFPVRDLIRAIFNRSSMGTGPAFVPIAIQLLRAIAALIRTGPFDTEFPADQLVGLILRRDIFALQETWRSYESSRLRRSATQRREDAPGWAWDDVCTPGSVGVAIYPREGRGNHEWFVTKTSFLRDFINAIVDAGLVKPNVVR